MENKIEAVPVFPGVVARYIAERERPWASTESTMPLVLESASRRDVDFLSNLLAECSSQFMAALHQHGAILLRGFEIKNNDDFSRTVLAVPGFRPIVDFFMPSAGRVRVKGSGTVFQTTNRYRTGGRFAKPGTGFHSESYYTTDSPSYQALWCKTPCPVGGETAFIHMARAYAALDSEVRAKLESDHVCAPQAWSTSEVAQHYGLSEPFIERFFLELGLPVIPADARKFIVLQKPSVYRHPYTHATSLQVHLGYELPEIQPILYEHFKPNYRGWRWSLHRRCWKNFRTRELAMTIEALVVRPASTFAEKRSSLFRKPDPPALHDNAVLAQIKRSLCKPRLAEKLPPSAAYTLAKAIAEHCSLFTWRAGDVVIFDNMQTMHGEMPGLGLRELRVIMCNPIPVKYPVEAGPTEITPDPHCESVDERLRAAAERRPVEAREAA